MNSETPDQRTTLQQIARRVMQERGLEPEFSAEALAELALIRSQPRSSDNQIRDLRPLLWCSIDNDDSMDLDQLTVAQTLPGGESEIFVAIADVDNLVKKGCAIDGHAQTNTTSIYTPAQIFPMLPEPLSTDLTSLADQQDRQAVVVEMTVNRDGALGATDIYRALVHNHAKLAYDRLAPWLEGQGPAPEPLATVPGLAENLKLQDGIAQALRYNRHEHGALELQTIQSRPVFDASGLSDLHIDEKNRAKELIEDLMIAANGVVARFLKSKNYPSLRRMVRVPKRWDRIVEVAAGYNVSLPSQPDPRALAIFLAGRKTADPLRFPDLSLAIVKLLGPGEYTVELPGQDAPGHFGLAVRDYTHATAPNRRFPDLITQRLVKAALTDQAPAYSATELATLAQHCTRQEDAANKVERQVEKSAAAMLLAGRKGEIFEGIITGASAKGTWARIFRPPVEGRVVSGFSGYDVGERLRVRLVSTDVEKGFIDFAAINQRHPSNSSTKRGKQRER